VTTTGPAVTPTSTHPELSIEEKRMLQQTIEKLHAMRLAAMADGLRNQMTQPEIAAMPFEERLAVLVDLQHSAMLNAALAQRLKRAGMRQTACIENLDLRTPRNLDRGTIHTLSTSQWVRQNLNVLVLGPAGIGKSWISCALGNRAARDGFSVVYKRLSRLLDELAVARLHGRQARALTTLARTRRDDHRHPAASRPLARYDRRRGDVMMPPFLNGLSVELCL
jgi:DNA replication protein DnaC